MSIQPSCSEIKVSIRPPPSFSPLDSQSILAPHNRYKMPAKGAGGPRKGQAGKKAQIEKMIAAAKKAQAPPPKCVSRKNVIVRLPPQGSLSSEKKILVYYNKPRPVAANPPKAFKNPNQVVVRLPAKNSSKQPTTFLSLPSEIRNVVYDYSMPRRKYGIQFIPRESKYEKRPNELTYCIPLHGKISGPGLTAADGLRRRNFDLPKRVYIDRAIPAYHLVPGPTALLLVSRKVSEETTPMFYGRHTFSFHTMRPLQKFLSTLRPKTRSMIRSLELIHHTAGNPGRTSDQVWKDSYDQRWHNLCFQIRDQCTGLDDLALDLTINDLPFHMGPLANWMGPLYAFMNLGHLKELYIRLHQFMTDDSILEVQAYEIRKELMGQNFYEPTTPVKAVFIEKPRAKVRPTVNSLRITGSMHNATTQQLVQRRLPPLNAPRATVFWHPPSPTDVHPLELPLGGRGGTATKSKVQTRKKQKSKGKNKARV